MSLKERRRRNESQERKSNGAGSAYSTTLNRMRQIHCLPEFRRRRFVFFRYDVRPAFVQCFCFVLPRLLSIDYSACLFLSTGIFSTLIFNALGPDSNRGGVAAVADRELPVSKRETFWTTQSHSEDNYQARITTQRTRTG